MKHSTSLHSGSWFPALLTAAAVSGSLAADEPVHQGFELQAPRVGRMSWFGTNDARRLIRPARDIQQAGAEQPPPAPEIDSTEPSATVRVQLPPRLEDAHAAAPGPTQLYRGQDSRYASSAWPRPFCPQPCSDIAFRPFGDSVMPTMGCQIYHGSANTLMLYDYDFYTADVARAAELTPRGLYQLEKLARRLEFTPAPIMIQLSETDPALNAARWQNVVLQLASMGLANPETLVVLGRDRFGVPGTEAVQTAEGLEYVIETRGRTVTPDSSARFGTGQVFSGFGR